MGPIKGSQLAIYLAQLLPECKVLLVSGNTLTASLLGDSNADGHNFSVLPKPAHPEDILQFLATVSTTQGPVAQSGFSAGHGHCQRFPQSHQSFVLGSGSARRSDGR